MSRITWYRIEKGESAVTMGAWMNAVTVVGLALDAMTSEEAQLIDDHAKGRFMETHSSLEKSSLKKALTAVPRFAPIRGKRRYLKLPAMRAMGVLA